MRRLGLIFALLYIGFAAYDGVINFDDLDATLGDIDLAGISPSQRVTWTNLSVYTNAPGFLGFPTPVASSNNATFGEEKLGSVFGDGLRRALSARFASARV